MGSVNVNRSNLLAVRLLQLRRHLTRCNGCKGAMKSGSPDLMCDATKTAILEIAIKWDANITGRLAARRSGEDYVFPCPDLNKHGPAYALTAEACVIAARQDRIF